jgi:hypothetical protein
LNMRSDDGFVLDLSGEKAVVRHRHAVRLSLCIKCKAQTVR